MKNVYEQCPIYETESFFLRLVKLEDAEDLLACYSDKDNVSKFNNDFCTSDFYYSTVSEIEDCIKFWLEEYQNQYYVRFSVINKADRKAIGTVEIFGGEAGVLRIDLSSKNNTEESFGEILKLTIEQINWIEEIKAELEKFNQPETTLIDMVIIPDAQEPIVTQEQWDRAQELRQHRRRQTSTGRQSLFAGLLFCGDCGHKLNFMTARRYDEDQGRYICSEYRSGRGSCSCHFIREIVIKELVHKHLRNVYHYYSCKNSRKNLCDKKIIKKEMIEDRVVSVCRKLLTDENIEKISKSVAAACQADYDGSGVKRIKAAIRETEAAIENLWIALEKGQSVDMITERIEKRKAEKAELEAQLAIEMNNQVIYTEPQIRHYLISLRTGDLNDINIRRGFINIFVRAIYLYDKKMTLYLNAGDKEIVIDDILIDETEEYFDSLNSVLNGGSAVVASVPPEKGKSKDLLFL